jgi:ABC-type sulfate transport system substrate-binding protein
VRTFTVDEAFRRLEESAEGALDDGGIYDQIALRNGRR